MNVNKREREKKKGGNSLLRPDWHLGGCGCSVLSANVGQIQCFYSLWANARHVVCLHSKMKTKKCTFHYCNSTHGDTIITFHMGVKAGLTFPGGRVDRKHLQSHPSHHLYKDKTNIKSPSSGHTMTDEIICTSFSFPSSLNAMQPTRTPWAGMFLISGGHARQPTERVGSPALARRKRVVLFWTLTPYLSISWSCCKRGSRISQKGF